MSRLRVGDRVLATRLVDGPRAGEVVEIYGRWSRWYGVRVIMLTGAHVYLFRRGSLVKLTNKKE